MSNFRAMTKANDSVVSKYPKFKDWQPANWIDNYFGPHRYGVQFDGDSRVLQDNGDLEANFDMPLPKEKS